MTYKEFYMPAKKGSAPWNKGKKCPQISEAKRGKSYLSEEGRQKKREKAKQLWEQGIFDNRPKPTVEQIKARAQKRRGQKQTDKHCLWCDFYLQKANAEDMWCRIANDLI